MRRTPSLIASLLVLACTALSTGCGDKQQQNEPGLVKSWGEEGVVKLAGFEVEQVLGEDSGRIIAVGLFQGRVAQVVRLLPDGSLDPSFGKGGVVRWPFHMFSERFPRGGNFLGWRMAALLPDGKIALAGTNSLGHVDETSTLIVSEIDQSGKVVESFGQSGYFFFDKRLYDCPASTVGKGCKRIFFELARKKTTCTRGPAGFAIQGKKIVVAAERFCEPFEPEKIIVMRLNPNGTADRSFGLRGEIEVSGTAPYASLPNPLLVLPDGRLVVAGTTARGGKVRLTGLLPDGKLDSHFGRNGVASTRVAIDSKGIQPLDVLLRDKRGNLSLTGSTTYGPFVVRFSRSGRPNYFWTGSPWIPSVEHQSNYENFGGAFGRFPAWAYFGQLSNGELVGSSNLLARITPQGVLDPTYPPQQVYGAGKLIPRGLLVTSDDTVLLTLLKYHADPGTFTTYLARYR